MDKTKKTKKCYFCGKELKPKEIKGYALDPYLKFKVGKDKAIVYCKDCEKKI